ncbi:DUF5689 domain-containing protein [Flavobacterium sp.]|uniref:DUF5689 domain-containing protein n=1 Tax=Flavobacterium sp. TaxID=239 RepID=UPI00374D91CD
MKNIIFKSIFLFLSIGFITGCVNEDFPAPTDTLKTYEFTTTTTVPAVSTAATTTPVLYVTDDIIEAYVTSSDEKGNFFKSISFQTLPVAGSAVGFSVSINASTLYGKGFTPGRKVYIKLKGLYTAKVDGSLKIGFFFEGGIGRIPENVWKDFLFPSVTIVSEEDLVRTMTLTAAYASTAIADANQNTLIELDPVQFAESSINRTYYDVDSGGGATNHSMMATTGGTAQVIRFSSFAPFTGNRVPSGSGKIRGVLTKFGSTYQFMVRYEHDIKLTNPRVDDAPPIVGNANVFAGTLNEPFTSYTITNQTNFPKYINDAKVGSRYWQLKTFSGNKYIEMSSFGGGGVTAKTYFLVPVDFTAANTFTFKKLARFYAGSTPLQVYYVKATDYAPGSIINLSAFTNITSNFTISYPAIGSSETVFTSPGSYAIPASLTGNGYFVFEYSGTPTLTTTIQVDDIVIN